MGWPPLAAAVLRRAGQDRAGQGEAGQDGHGQAQRGDERHTGKAIVHASSQHLDRVPGMPLQAPHSTSCPHLQGMTLPASLLYWL